MSARFIMAQKEIEIQRIDEQIFNECGEWPADAGERPIVRFVQTAPDVLQRFRSVGAETPRHTRRRAHPPQPVFDPWQHCEEPGAAEYVVALGIALMLLFAVYASWQRR